MPVDTTTFEKHYRIGDLARIWGIGRETVRRLIKDDPGVIKIRMGRKKLHTFYSVPEICGTADSYSPAQRGLGVATDFGCGSGRV